jgi:hypothetical protein
MDAFADYIGERLKSKRFCVVSERELERVLPSEGLSPRDQKRIAIFAFARENNWKVTIYDTGLRVTFRKQKSWPQRKPSKRALSAM